MNSSIDLSKIDLASALRRVVDENGPASTTPISDEDRASFVQALREVADYAKKASASCADKPVA